jgi:carotenoid cleavage dioxygenase-like enzyme
MTGKPMAAWETERPSVFGVMAKGSDGQDIRWIETDPTFMFHIANSEMRKHLLAEQRCTDLWNQLIAERKARLTQMREDDLTPEPVKQPNPKPL